MRETRLLNGVEFELMGKTNTQSSMDRYEYSNIFEAYDKPSETKVAIWYEWLDWSSKFDYSDIWVSSRNCFMFTIRGFVCDNDVWYNVYITRDYNRVWVVE